MVLFGIEVIKVWVDIGVKLELILGKDFFDIGVVLVIDKFVDGVDFIDIIEGINFCWG